MILLLACTGQNPDVDDTQLFYDGEPGLFRLSFEHDAVTRESIVVVPTTYEVGGPLLLNFHGFGGSGADHYEWTGMAELAEAEGFILALPTGTELDGSPHWNAALDSPDNKSEADDLGFARKLVETVEASYGIDRERVYAVGYSNGGMFSFALACYASDLVAAVGAVSGTMLTDEDCEPTHPTSVVTLHGTADDVLPYGGDEGSMPQEDIVEYWAGFNATTESSQDREGDIARFDRTDGEGGAAVRHYKVEGGQHVWFELDYEGRDTNTLIWEFFDAFDRSGAR